MSCGSEAGWFWHLANLKSKKSKGTVVTFQTLDSNLSAPDTQTHINTVNLYLHPKLALSNSAHQAVGGSCDWVVGQVLDRLSLSEGRPHISWRSCSIPGLNVTFRSQRRTLSPLLSLLKVTDQSCCRRISLFVT